MVWALVTCIPPPSNLNGQYPELCEDEGGEAGKMVRGDISMPVLSKLSTPFSSSLLQPRASEHHQELASKFKRNKHKLLQDIYQRRISIAVMGDNCSCDKCQGCTTCESCSCCTVCLALLSASFIPVSSLS